MRASCSLVFLLASIGLGMTLTSCGPSTAPAAIRFSVIPDSNKARLAEASAELATFLTERLGVPVRYEPSNDYTACVNGLVADKLDFVWLGGKTTTDAIDLGQGVVHVLATRDIDLQFKSYFIGNREAMARAGVAPTADLSQWKGKTSDLRLTFGDRSSTSGHLMPRYFLAQAGIKPETDFAQVGYALGGHSGTLQAVASGAVDIGVLNYATYDAASPELRERAPVLHTTPEYVDYAFVIHDRVGKERIAGIRQAILGLTPESPRGERILRAWQAGRFVAAEDRQWEAIRTVRDSLRQEFLK